MMQKNRTVNPAYRSILAAILVVAVLLRTVAAFYLGNVVEELPGTFDQISYHTLALRLLGGHGFSFDRPWWPLTATGAPTAHWSFLYTLYLAGVYKVLGPHPFAARLIQAVIVGLLQPYLAYKLGRRVYGEKVGLATAGLTAVYAYFIYYAASLMTEPFYITGILAVLYFTLRLAEANDTPSWKEGLALGILLGAVIYLRQLFMLFVPFLFLWLWYAAYRKRGSMPLATTIAAGVTVVLMILPATLYNYARFERFVLLNTNAGYVFYWANHPIYGTQFEPILPPEMGTYQALIPESLRHLDEATLDQALLKRGLEFVIRDPVRYALLSLSRIPSYFMFWPSVESSLISNLARLLSFGLLWPFMLYGLIHCLAQLKSDSTPHPVGLLVLFSLFYTIVHVLSWTLIRYRLPVDAVLLVFAGLTCIKVREHLQEARNVQQTTT